jgi:hypothetical protein
MPAGAFRPITGAGLVERLADWVTAPPGTVRVAIDGPPCARPAQLADALVEPLRLRGREAVVVRAELFWRDASLRLEYGRQDVDSYSDWLDRDALRREVLDAVLTDRSFLPSLRDPETNRSTREPCRSAPPGTVVLVSGAFLLGRGLPFDRTVHLYLSPAARVRRTPVDEHWTLPALDRYEREVEDDAEVLVKLDDPRHPAVAGSLG